MKTMILTLICTLAVSAGGNVASAQDLSEKLESGIYQEETAGNLAEAIKIYREVVADAKQLDEIAAQAQFRLAICLRRSGNADQAAEAFRELIERFPDQTDLVAKARQQLPDSPELLPAPWQDGEQTTLLMKLPGGQTIGLVGLNVTADKDGERDVWRMSVRRYIAGSENQGVSQIVVDRESNRPMSSTWRHTILGQATGAYSNDSLVVTQVNPLTGEETQSEHELTGFVFENDQVFYSIRQLPLKVGYEVTLPVRVAFSGGNQVEIGITVPKMETIETSAGTFECFLVEMNIGQRFFVANTPQRPLVRFEAGGVIGEIAAIGPAESHTFRNEQQGSRVTLPKQWHAFVLDGLGTSGGGQLFMVGPSLVECVLIVTQRDVTDHPEHQTVRDWAEDRSKRRKSVVQGFELLGNGFQAIKMAESDGEAFEYRGKLGSLQFVGGESVALTEERAILFASFVEQSIAEEQGEVISALRDSIAID